jgi:hypothetical protein
VKSCRAARSAAAETEEAGATRAALKSSSRFCSSRRIVLLENALLSEKIHPRDLIF